MYIFVIFCEMFTDNEVHFLVAVDNWHITVLLVLRGRTDSFAFQLSCFLPLPRRICFRRCLSVCLSVCLLATLRKNFLNGFA